MSPSGASAAERNLWIVSHRDHGVAAAKVKNVVLGVVQEVTHQPLDRDGLPILVAQHRLALLACQWRQHRSDGIATSFQIGEFRETLARGEVSDPAEYHRSDFKAVSNVLARRPGLGSRAPVSIGVLEQGFQVRVGSIESPYLVLASAELSSVETTLVAEFSHAAFDVMPRVGHATQATHSFGTEPDVTAPHSVRVSARGSAAERALADARFCRCASAGSTGLRSVHRPCRWWVSSGRESGREAVVAVPPLLDHRGTSVAVALVNDEKGTWPAAV